MSNTKYKNVEERINLNVKRAKNGCLEWQLARNQDGYGVVRLTPETTIHAHRLAWVTFVGPIPEGMCVLHHCDNPACCDVNHLFLGTKADNAADRVRKGRSSRLFGENNGAAVLTHKQVRAIRALAKEGWQTKELAEMFNASRQTIRNVKSRRRYGVVK